MNPILSVLLAANLVYGQAAATQPHPDAWFGIDKIKHFFMSAFIESLTFSGLQAAGARRNTAFAGAVGVTAAFGIGKEFHDKRKGELFSIRDLTWDAAGAGAAVVMLKSTQR